MPDFSDMADKAKVFAGPHDQQCDEVSDEAWSSPWTRAIALLLNGKTLQTTDEDGNWVVDDSFLLLVNASHEGVEFTLPQSPSCNPWCQVVDTENLEDPFVRVKAADKIIMGGRALKLLSDGAAD